MELDILCSLKSLFDLELQNKTELLEDKIIIYLADDMIEIMIKKEEE